MGTNFYLKRKLSQELKKKLKDLIDNDSYEDAKNLLLYTDKIHIGKRSAGWKFLWNIHNFEFFNPNEESIYKWLKSKDSFIVDEYGRVYDFDEFINNISFKGYDLESYYRDYPNYGNKYMYVSSILSFKQRCCISNVPNINDFGEFYIGKLRCTVFDEFS